MLEPRIGIVTQGRVRLPGSRHPPASRTAMISGSALPRRAAPAPAASVVMRMVLPRAAGDGGIAGGVSEAEELLEGVEHRREFVEQRASAAAAV